MGKKAVGRLCGGTDLVKMLKEPAPNTAHILLTFLLQMPQRPDILQNLNHDKQKAFQFCVPPLRLILFSHLYHMIC